MSDDQLQLEGCLPASRAGTECAPDRTAERWWRAEIYCGRVIITNGVDYMRFWSNRRHDSLAEIRTAIDMGNDGGDEPKGGPG